MKRTSFITVLLAAAFPRAAFSATHKEHHMSLADIQNPEALHTATHSLDLFRISQLIRVRTPIAPDRIESFPDVEKTHVTDAATIGEFYAALAAAQPKPDRHGVEYRWKAVAYDAAGERIAEIYASAISRYGRYGDNTTFEFTNDEFAKAFNKLAPEAEAATH